MFRQPVNIASPRKIAAVLTAVALATAGLSARSDAAPSDPTSALGGADLWSGDWLAEGQNTEGGAFSTFGVITFEVVGPAESDVDTICKQGDLLYEGSYEYGGGGTVSGCSYEPDVLAGDYFNNGGTWGQFLIERKGDAWEGVYSPPTTNPAGVPATLKWRGKREAEGCEASGASFATSRRSGTGSARTTTAGSAAASTELARPDPIEGTWLHCAGDIRVTSGAEDGSFAGTAGHNMSFPGCKPDYLADDNVWDITVEASTPNSTLYRGTFECGGVKRQATWEVFPQANPMPDTMDLCPTDAGSEPCASFIRNGQVSRRFGVSLSDGRPNKPMNAVGLDTKGNVTPKHALYLTTTAELKNGGFRAMWDPEGENFHDFSKPTGNLIIEDLYFPPHRDELTRLKIIGFKEVEAYVVLPGRDAENVPPSTFFVVKVKVQSSEWKRCPDDAKGELHLGWNQADTAGQDQLAVIVCGRTRTYRHHVPDDESKVDIELIDPPR